MKHTDPLDEDNQYFVDGLIDQAVETERERHMEQKGRLLKQRCAEAMKTPVADSNPVPEHTL